MSLFAPSALASKDLLSYFGTFAGSGSLGGEFNNPRDIAVNETGIDPASAGDVYVADEANNRIERFDSAGSFVSAWGKDTIASAINERQWIVVEGTGGAFRLSFDGSATEPIAYKAGAENELAASVRSDLAALPTVAGSANVAVSGDGTAINPLVVTFQGTLGGANQPTIAADASELSGTIEVSTPVNGTSTVADDTGAGFEICTHAAECQAGTASGENGALDHPQSVAVDPDTGNVYVSDRNNRRIDEYDSLGGFIRSFGWDVVESGPNQAGTGLEDCVQAEADVCKAGTAGGGSGQYGPGAPTIFETGHEVPVGFGIAVSPDGNPATGSVYLADTGNRRIQQFDISGDFVSMAGGGVIDGGATGTGTVTSGSTSVTSVLTTSRAFAVGQTIEGTGVEPNTTIIALSEGTITLSQAANASATGAGTALTVATPAAHVANNEVQELVVSRVRPSYLHTTNGNFKLKFATPNPSNSSQETANIPFNATATQVQSALAALPNIGTGNVSVALVPGGNPGGEVEVPGGPWRVTFTGKYADTNVETLERERGSPDVNFPSQFEISTPVEGSSAAETCTAAISDLCRSGAGGTEAGTGQFGPGQPASIATDSRGILYASNSSNAAEVERYDTVGADGEGFGFLEPIVAPGDEVQEIAFAGFEAGDAYTLTCPDGSPTEELTYTSGTGSVGQPVGAEIIQNGLEAACGEEGKKALSTSGNPPSVRVTFEGALAGANQPQMTCAVVSGSGNCSVSTIDEGHPGPLLAGSTAGLAVNPAGNVLYVLRDPSKFGEPTVVQQLGPIGEPGLSAAPTEVDETHGAAAGFGGAQGFDFDGTRGRFYLSATTSVGGQAAGHRVYVLADSSALPNPTASMPSSGAVTAIADRSATFHGEVNPGGGLVGCKFQYSTDEVSWADVPVPNCAALSENGGAQGISQEVTSLVPGERYFVRLQVTRPYFPSLTPVTSDEVSFTTATGPPVLSGAAASAVDEHSVRLTATIEPGNSPTSYVVEYGTTPSLGSSTAPVNIGAGSTPIELTRVISGLSTATQYYFKLVATNLTGSAASESLAIATFASSPSFGSCSNDRFRTGPSAKLPDCRAYEQVTPTDKYGSDAYGTPYSVEGSTAGDGVTFYTLAGFPGAESFGSNGVFLSRFADGQWSTAGIVPPSAYGDSGTAVGWTPDLRLTFASARSTELIVAGYSGATILMRDSSGGSWTTLVPQQGGGSPNWKGLAGALDSDSKVVFESTGQVPVSSGPAWTGAKTRNNLYLYDRETGALTLVDVLPDSACGSPPCLPANGAEAPKAYGSYVQDGHSVSPAGVYFTDVKTGKLYLRRDVAGPGATTVQVSTSERTDCADHDPCGGTLEPDSAGTFAPTFMGATPDGAHAFFTSEEELTDTASTASGAKDLYRFDADAPAGQRLTDLVPGAKVVGMLGYSNGVDYVYFVANADLDGAGPATTGHCADNSGPCSLYLWQAEGTGGCSTTDGCVTFVARLHAEDGDGYDWAGGESGMKASRVSADGRVLVFRTGARLTEYDNRETPEFYRYAAESGHFICLTCDPTGAPPTGEPQLKNPDMWHSPSSHTAYEGKPFLSGNLSSDGNRFFFQTPQKLVPADVNGEVSCPNAPNRQTGAAGGNPSCTDVYEWEAPNALGGSCTEGAPAYSPSNNGCLYLLSTGTGPYPSYLADVSESGDTAFIFSRQQLLPSDEDTQEDIYAVKVGGGLAYQHAVRPAACEGDACRGAASQASDVPGAGTAVFEGPGNSKQNTNRTRCPKGKRTVRSEGKVRCVAKKHGHKKQKRHHRRAANNNRRASR